MGSVRMRLLVTLVMVALGCLAQEDDSLFVDSSNQDYREEQISSQNSSIQEDPSTPRVQNPIELLPPTYLSHLRKEISKSMAKFALNLDKAIGETSSQKENILVSPTTLTYTLAMILLASVGKTFKEVAKVLNFGPELDIYNHSEVMHQYLGYIIEEYNKSQALNASLPTCKLSSGIFVQKGYHIRKQFKEACEKIYKSEITNVDFARNNTDAKNIINKWVSDKTMGMIQEILSDPPQASSKVIISSALYFNGSWRQEFSNNTQKSCPFHVSRNETVYVDMMTNEDSYPFYIDPKLNLKIIGLPYKGNETVMYVILPNQSGPDSVRRLKGRLTPDLLDKLISKMKETTVAVSFPKMKLSSNLQLRDALRQLGLESLFDPATANLSILSEGRRGNAGRNSHKKKPTGPSSNDPSQNQTIQEIDRFIRSTKLPRFGVDKLRRQGDLRNPGIFADEVIHAVEMTVDEKGTEAAAADVVLTSRSLFIPDSFVADKPFLFFIRHNPTKSILFWGSIIRPTPFSTKQTPDKVEIKSP